MNSEFVRQVGKVLLHLVIDEGFVHAMPQREAVLNRAVISLLDFRIISGALFFRMFALQILKIVAFTVVAHACSSQLFHYGVSRVSSSE